MFDRYGTLYNAETESDAGFILPVLAPGEYDITLAYMECSVTSSIFVRDIMADLENSIKGEITTIAGDIATIKTDLGEIAVSLADLNAKVVEIAGDVATIETDLGELRVDLSKQTSVIAGIASGETKVIVDSTPTWIAAVMAVIAAVSAIGSMVILVRKLA